MYKYHLDHPTIDLGVDNGKELAGAKGHESQTWTDPRPSLRDSYDTSRERGRGKEDVGDGDREREREKESVRNSNNIDIIRGRKKERGKSEEGSSSGDRDMNRGRNEDGDGDRASEERANIGENGLSKGWTLPFRSSHLRGSPSPSIITQEFKRLDLLGEGRLTYLTLKSALELREIKVADSTVRRWLKEMDRGGQLLSI